jgi:hypothetical protein
MPIIVTDPLGNEIAIANEVLQVNEKIWKEEGVIDDVTKVIQKPLMLFRMNEGNVDFFYFRAIGWNKTMLIGVQKREEHLEAVNYEIDPPVATIGILHKNGERMI